MRWLEGVCGAGLFGLVTLVTVSGCSRYLQNAKLAEARTSVGAIGRAAANAYEYERLTPAVVAEGAPPAISRSLCGSAVHTVPASSEAIRGKKYASTREEWAEGSSTVGWPCLKFEMNAPQYFMYGYRITGRGDKAGDSFTVTANGDLNGDGKMSTIQLTGVVGPSKVDVAPQLNEVDPYE